MLQLQSNERKAKRLTQKEAARRLGVTYWYLNRVLRGHITSIRLSRRYRELEKSFEMEVAQ